MLLLEAPVGALAKVMLVVAAEAGMPPCQLAELDQLYPSNDGGTPTPAPVQVYCAAAGEADPSAAAIDRIQPILARFARWFIGFIPAVERVQSGNSAV